MPNGFDIIRETGPNFTPEPDEPIQLAVEPGVAESPKGRYLLSAKLATTVNVALTLDQPLLVTGEPGCGKTSLAWAVARQLGCEVYPFYVKSTSTARDLLYTIDNLRRFHDASAGDETARDVGNYLTYRALGQAIRSEVTSVVLIDEIDKAPRDFPNDLLHELDSMEFTVSELTPVVHHKQRARHFVLITSNSERQLPMPFLRRCAYMHIDFPNEEALRNIVRLHCPDPSDSFVELVVKRFLELRAIGDLIKPPATSELIAWVRVLHSLGVNETMLAGLPLAELPALEALIKLLDDRKRLLV